MQDTSGRVATGSPWRQKTRGPRTREDQRLKRKLADWSRRSDFEPKATGGWSPTVVTGDLRATAVQTANGRPLNLVPPSDFEPTVDREYWRLVRDDTERCKWKAERRKQGKSVPTTNIGILRALEEDTVEEKAAKASLERIKAQNGVAPAQWPENKPAAFTHRHRQRVMTHGAHLRPMKDRSVLFTGTLSDGAVEFLSCVPNGWGKLVATFNRELTRRLRRRNAPVWWVGVAELQTERALATGIPGMHVHYAICNKMTGRFHEPFILSKAELGQMWNAAIRNVCGPTYVDEPSRTDIEMIRHDPAGYLAKYMSKGSDTDLVDWDQWVGMIPKQWVYVSPDLRAHEKATQVHLSGDQVEWAVTNGDWLKEVGICHVRVFAPADIPVGNIACIQFYGVKHLSHFLALFERDVRRQLASHVGLIYGESSEGEFDPVLACGLPVPAADLQPYDRMTIPVRDLGRVPDEFRESIERIFREVDIPEPVLVPAVPFVEECPSEAQLFLDLGSAFEVQDALGAD